MPTDIVFGGGHEIRVTDDRDQVHLMIDQHEPGGPLLGFNLAGERDGEVLVNPGAVAYIRTVQPGSWRPQ